MTACLTWHSSSSGKHTPSHIHPRTLCTETYGVNVCSSRQTDTQRLERRHYRHLRGIWTNKQEVVFTSVLSCCAVKKQENFEACPLHVCVTWMRLAAGFLLFSKCFCRCCSCTLRAKPDPRIPCMPKGHTRTSPVYTQRPSTARPSQA